MRHSVLRQALLGRNPLDIPPQLILDPSLPVPRGLSKKAALRLAELREAYQWSVNRAFDRKKINDPGIAAELLIPLMAPLHVEHLCVLPLDSQCKLIGDPVLVTRGDVDGVDAGPRAIVRAALKADAVQMIIAHNHPAGSPEPSAADRAVTQRVATAGRAIDIPLRDHLIIAPPTGWTSLMRYDPGLFR